MKRDLDLTRQLLFDIEARGADCSLGAVRSGADREPIPREAINGHGGDDAVRYHLRLLIDAGLVKEVDRTNAGVPCVRLTSAGHELIELCRSDLRWRDAKACCLDATGGLSLAVIRTILTRWAVEGTGRGERYRRYAGYRPYYYHRVEPRRRYEQGRYDAYRYEEARYAPTRYEAPRYEVPRYEAPVDPVFDDVEPRYVRTRPDDYRNGWFRPAQERDYVVRETPAYETVYTADESAEPTVGVSLPVSLI